MDTYGLVEGAELANPHLTHMSAVSQKIPAWLVHVVSNPIELFKPQTFTVHFWTATFATYVNMQQLCSSCATPLAHWPLGYAVLYSAPAFQTQERQRALAVQPRLLLVNEGLWTDPADWMVIQSHPKQIVLIDRGIIIQC